jgi:hypothetical protein
MFLKPRMNEPPSLHSLFPPPASAVPRMGQLYECFVGTNTRKDMGGNAELGKTVEKGKELHVLAIERIVMILI